MNFPLDGGVFRRQSESVKADRRQDVKTAHFLETRVDVRRRKIVPVPDVQIAGRIREHHEMIKIFLSADFVANIMNPAFRPRILRLFSISR